MLSQLEREFLQADLAQVRALLSDTSSSDDPIGHFQFSQRATLLERKLAALSDAPPQTPPE